MAVSQKLEVRQGQQLIMTPQLQQAIKLLQLTNLELQEFVEQQLLENPFLERDERDNGPQRGDGAGEAEGSEDHRESELKLSNNDHGENSALDTDYDNIDPNASVSEKSEFERHEPGNNDWSTVSSSGGHDLDGLDRDAGLTREKTLHEHLGEQLMMSTACEVQRLIGAVLIDMIDDGGYLRGTLGSVAERLGVEEDIVEDVLKIIQGFEPAGVGARDLRECLQLQMEDAGRYSDTMRMFLDNLHFLGAADIDGLKRATRLPESEIRSMIGDIRRLTPKPGFAYGADPVQLVVPDVYVRQSQEGGWKIELNTQTLPKVLANQTYYTELSASCRKEDEKEYLSTQMSNANWLVKSLDQRARTILKVSAEIVRQQDTFFVHGVKYLKPLNLKTVADAISMHESTVSRVTSNKYMSTSRGVFELKYFFTSAISASTGGVAHSAEAVRHRIGELIDAEDPARILSDDRLVEILRQENIDIARRTVAKYREAMNIPSSVIRRRVKQRAAKGF